MDLPETVPTFERRGEEQMDVVVEIVCGWLASNPKNRAKHFWTIVASPLALALY